MEHEQRNRKKRLSEGRRAAGMAGLAATGVLGGVTAFADEAPAAGRLMKEIVGRLSGCSVVGETVTILSSPDNGDSEALSVLAEAVSASVLDGGATPEDSVAAAKTWVFKICGYVYEGDEVPDDYTCPICGAGKSAFEEG